MSKTISLVIHLFNALLGVFYFQRVGDFGKSIVGLGGLIMLTIALISAVLVLMFRFGRIGTICSGLLAVLQLPPLFCWCYYWDVFAHRTFISMIPGWLLAVCHLLLLFCGVLYAVIAIKRK